MLRKSVLAVFTLAICFGIAMAEDIRAVILKVDGDKVTFAPTKGKGKKGDEQTLPAASDIKVSKAKFNADAKKFEAGDAIEGGLKADVFSKIDAEKGLPATVVTDADGKKITAIYVGGKKKGN
jgi:hypothetical protein